LRSHHIDCESGAKERLPHVTEWSSSHRFHDELPEGDDVLVAIGIGGVHAADAAHAALHDLELEAAAFPVADLWAVRVQSPGASKGDALATLALRLGVEREDVCAVGDWHNDISMLSWAGQSFAMGGSPEPVREAARATLECRAGEGGGVAEAIERWHQS
jgi:hypothetical protein